MPRTPKDELAAERTGPNANDERLFEVTTDTLGSSPSYQRGDRIRGYETAFEWQYLLDNGAVRVVPEDEADARPTAQPQETGLPPAVLLPPQPAAEQPVSPPAADEPHQA